MSREERQALIEDGIAATRMHQIAQDQFDEAACSYLGINRTDGRCLDFLDLAGGRMTAGQLAEATGLTTGAITTLLDRLERKGYVRRVRDTVDRRRVLVESTPLVGERAGAIWGPIAEEGVAGLAAYSDGELALIRDFLRSGTEFLTRHLERVKALPPALDDARERT